MAGLANELDIEEGVVGTSELQLVGQKHRYNLDLGLASEVGAREQFCRTEPLTCGICHCLQVHSVRSELNCTPLVLERIACCWGKNPHTGIGCRIIGGKFTKGHY